MKKLTLFLMAIVAVLLTATPLFAAEAENTGGYPEMPGQSDFTGDLLYGLTVYSQAGQKIGVIRNVNVGKESGIVNYVDIVGTNAKGEEKSYPVPPEALNIDVEHGKATLLFAEDKLENLPPLMGKTEDYRVMLDEHYGISPNWDEKTGKAGTMMNKKAAPTQEKSEY